MLDAKIAIKETWEEFKKEHIPVDAPPQQVQDMTYAFYRGMHGFMRIMHKATTIEHDPTEDEIADFMNGLDDGLGDFYDGIYPKEVVH